MNLAESIILRMLLCMDRPVVSGKHFVFLHKTIQLALAEGGIPVLELFHPGQHRGVVPRQRLGLDPFTRKFDAPGNIHHLRYGKISRVVFRVFLHQLKPDDTSQENQLHRSCLSEIFFSGIAREFMGIVHKTAQRLLAGVGFCMTFTATRLFPGYEDG